MPMNRDDYPRDDRWSADRDGAGRRDDRDNERGFFERAGEEIASWFGDDDPDRRRERDDRGRDEPRGQRRFPGGTGDDSYRSDRYDRSRMVEDGYRRPYTGRAMEREQRPEQRGGYQPMTGDYARAGRDSGREARRDSERAGSAAATATPAHDRHYSEWRQRQMAALDRDYDDYRREHQSKFESDFSTWRAGREDKRKLLSQVREHMDVVGSDDQPVGKVDHVRRDRVILTRNDSDDGRHHAVGCAMFDRIDGDRLMLNVPAEEAKAKVADEARGRALFEREEQGSDGPHVLDRSFSGTY